MLAFPEIRVGLPLAHGSLTVFPLFAEAPGRIDYLLSDEAIASGAVTVAEIDQHGSVPMLSVENRADLAVLFLEGEELRGAKQNRVLNTSVLVAASCKTPIPVSCVEQGRWRYTSPHFSSGGKHASYKLRHLLKKSVVRSSLEGRGHRSDQGEVWNEVDRQMMSLGSHSPTGAMADTYEAHRNRLDEFREQLKYVDGSAGLAVAVGAKVVSVDLFDKPITCRKVWDRLLTGFVLDALECAITAGGVGADDVSGVLTTLCEAPWRSTPAACAREEFRAEWADNRHACALTFEGTVLHGSLIAG
jgi:hypothetical protein